VEKGNSKTNFTLHPINIDSEILLPFIGGVSAGFTSPATDYICDKIDLNKELISHPSTTFIAKVEGECLKDSGISDGDLVIVDKLPQPRHGDLAVCFIDGEFTMKRIRVTKETIWLMPDNEKYKPIKVTPENSFCIWGIITYSIKKHR